jgi:hypothetical protein
VLGILSDAEFQQKIQSGNPIELLTNSALLELAHIILSDSAAPGTKATRNSKNNQGKSDLPSTPKKNTKLYTWTDDRGVIHLSDIEPES